MKKIWLIAVVALSLGLMAICGGCSKQSDIEESLKNKEADFKMTASDLAGEFQKNLVNANDKFTDKIVEITGPIAKVYNDASNRMVEITSGNPNILVDCYFADSHQDELAKLNKDDEITIKGKCKGLAKYVEVEGCSFVKEE